MWEDDESQDIYKIASPVAKSVKCHQIHVRQSSSIRAYSRSSLERWCYGFGLPVALLGWAERSGDTYHLVVMRREDFGDRLARATVTKDKLISSGWDDDGVHTGRVVGR